MARFTAGNKLATGGAREGAGRKPDALKQSLAELMDATVPITERKAIIKAMVEQAKLGDIRAAAFIFDRIYGKPKETIEMSGGDNDQAPIVVNFNAPHSP